MTVASVEAVIKQQPCVCSWAMAHNKNSFSLINFYGQWREHADTCLALYHWLFLTFHICPCSVSGVCVHEVFACTETALQQRSWNKALQNSQSEMSSVRMLSANMQFALLKNWEQMPTTPRQGKCIVPLPPTKACLTDHFNKHHLSGWQKFKSVILCGHNTLL